MLEAFEKVPDLGYLAASLRDDPNDSASQYLKFLREEQNAYERRVVRGVAILEGPAGGGCAMTSRALYDRIGGFRESKHVFWHEDAAYASEIRRLGYRMAILEGVTVWHAGSPYYSKTTPAKAAFHKRHVRATARKNRIKALLLRLPLFARLNAHFDWFDPPHTYVPPKFQPFDDGSR
jgi:GT2 family glycosyltransferase